MRKALYDYLTTNCETITTWLQPYRATKSTEKPYGVIVVGEELRSPFNRRGSFRDLYIWPYFGGSSYLPVDAAINEIRHLLHGALLTTEEGNRFMVEFVAEGRDFYDDELEALTRRLDFTIPNVIRG